MEHLHSYWAYIVVILLIIAFINAVIGLTSKKEFKSIDLRISLFTLIAVHLQLIIGLIWYYFSPTYKMVRETGMGESMKNSDLRLLAVEHPLMMIAAIVFITIGFSKHKKKATDNSKFKTIAIFYGIALLLVLSRIPWNQWF